MGECHSGEARLCIFHPCIFGKAGARDAKSVETLQHLEDGDPTSMRGFTGTYARLLTYASRYSPITLLATAVKCALLIMALRVVGIPEDALGWSAIFAVYALVAGLTVVPITPGSAGVAELALVGMLAPIAGDAYINEVAAGVLVYRLLTWILLIPVGLVALGGWRLQQRRKETDAIT